MRSRVHKDLSLTQLGFGASQLGKLYRETTDEESAAAIDSAWDQGPRYFDTAPHYGLGLSERRLSRDGVLRSIEASLERLNTDRLDVVYIHDPDTHWAAASTSAADALIELRDQALRHPAVVSVVVGSRTSAQVESNVQRYAAHIPDELWTDLTELGLIPSSTQTGISA